MLAAVHQRFNIYPWMMCGLLSFLDDFIYCGDILFIFIVRPFVHTKHLGSTGGSPVLSECVGFAVCRLSFCLFECISLVMGLIKLQAFLWVFLSSWVVISPISFRQFFFCIVFGVLCCTRLFDLGYFRWSITIYLCQPIHSSVVWRLPSRFVQVGLKMGHVSPWQQVFTPCNHSSEN